MASVLSTSSIPLAIISFNSGFKTTTTCQMKNPSPIVRHALYFIKTSFYVERVKAKPETLQIVQNTIAKQLSIDETTVTPQTKFSDLGADSLDIVEIMMALEEKFGISIGDGGAENISTVKDAANLIEKVKTAST
ncbi:uncharacterized protein LOC113851051 [Abrus precatorius]|uniref:Acyl carrier protein n=1 Tax=Abrus precatorius TaxID=3816 RepID=A0A8B8K0V2_ABRPR|nr:uncharacterized protein LOC113851051 [Abrus precatorius]